MGTYAVIRDGVVENMVVWDEETKFSPEGCEVVKATSDARIGGTYDGAFHFVEPAAPEPTAEAVARQAKLDSAKSKLEALGLTTEEVQEAFGL